MALIFSNAPRQEPSVALFAVNLDTNNRWVRQVMATLEAAGCAVYCIPQQGPLVPGVKLDAQNIHLLCDRAVVVGGCPRTDCVNKLASEGVNVLVLARHVVPNFEATIPITVAATVNLHEVTKWLAQDSPVRPKGALLKAA